MEYVTFKIKGAGFITVHDCHGWDNFLCRGSYVAVFWIFDENSSDNTLMFCCCRVVLAWSQGHFTVSCCPAYEGKHQDSGRRLASGMSRTMWHHAQQEKQR